MESTNEKGHMLAALPTFAMKEAAFYRPIVRENIMGPGFDPLPAVIYPCLGIEKLIRRDRFSALIPHVKFVADSNIDRILSVKRKPTKLLLVILWPNGDDIMTDVWSFANPKDGVQTQFKVSTFRSADYVSPEKVGTGAIASNWIAAMETSHLLRYGSVSEYLRADRPETSLVDGDFYQ